MPGAGLTLYSLATPALPFGRDNLAAISDDDYVAPPATCSAGECARGLLQGLLRVGVGERLTAAQGLEMIESARAEAEETERRRDDTARRADERRVAAEGVAGRERERRQEVEMANAEMHQRIAELEARLESFEGVPPPQLFSPSAELNRVEVSTAR
jgi:hypothetical protein